MKVRLWITIAILAFASVACSVTLPFSLNDGDIGDTKTLNISETHESTEPVEVVIEMGGGQLYLEGGSDRLVEGTVTYNVSDWKPEVRWEGSELTIHQDLTTIPIEPNRDIENNWDLRLGDQPIALKINAGAYEGTLDLSGLSIVRLEIQDGASDAEVHFNAPNPVRMESFRYQTGASDVSIIGLANANVAEFTFNGGAGQAVLDFSGTLENDMHVEINGGVGSVRVVVPPGTQVVLNLKGDLVNVNNDGWEKEGDRTYTLAGDGPRIVIDANLNVGSLDLEVR